MAISWSRIAGESGPSLTVLFPNGDLFVFGKDHVNLQKITVTLALGSEDENEIRELIDQGVAQKLRSSSAHISTEDNSNLSGGDGGTQGNPLGAESEKNTKTQSKVRKFLKKAIAKKKVVKIKYAPDSRNLERAFCYTVLPVAFRKGHLMGLLGCNEKALRSFDLNGIVAVKEKKSFFSKTKK